jgi:hypothetical protein
MDRRRLACEIFRNIFQNHSTLAFQPITPTLSAVRRVAKLAQYVPKARNAGVPSTRGFRVLGWKAR